MPKKPGTPYAMPKAKLRVPKQKATANKRTLSKMKTRLAKNPFAKKK